ncbi:MAG TPA: DUF4332 domain-containing protein [Myxococcota bacterium]|nr:DUF4332 domain-containing protein [Myxococcota bacterium]
MTSPRPKLLLALLFLLALAGTANASHYSLSKVDFVTAAERKAFARAGIHDTQVMLDWLQRQKDRTWVGRQTGLSEERLRELAARCDLLRITGIGPSIADALMKSEVLDVYDLARDEPGELLSRLRVATRGTPMARLLPAEDTLATWIRDAKRLQPLLDFDPWEVESLLKQIKTGRVREAAPPIQMP